MGALGLRGGLPGPQGVTTSSPKGTEGDGAIFLPRKARGAIVEKGDGHQRPPMRREVQKVGLVGRSEG